MARITVGDARTFAANAGFTGSALDTIVAIAQAESGLVTDAVNINSNPPSIDNGILQINDKAHPLYTLAQCDDPATAMRLGFQISHGGTNFTPWTTYQSGAYKKFLPSGPGPGQPPPDIKAPWSPADSARVWSWLLPLAKPHLTQLWGEGDPTNPERGIDIGVHTGTPITSLTFGVVLSAGYYDGGGVIAIASQLRDIGVASVYYQHLDTIYASTVGMTVQVGDIIGLSGGQLSGGSHPATSQYSSGPHIEVGINAPYKQGLWHPLGKNIDPLPWLQDLAANGPPSADLLASVGLLGALQAASDQTAGGYGTAAGTFSAALQALDDALAFHSINYTDGLSGWNWLPWNWAQVPLAVAQNVGKSLAHNGGALFGRLFIVLIGLAIILAFVFHVLGSALHSPEGQAVEHAAEGAATVAAVAA